MASVPITSGPNRNKYWLNNRGMWLGYLTTVAILHCLILSIPFLTTPQAWTLTHVIHNIVSANGRLVVIMIILRSSAIKNGGLACVNYAGFIMVCFNWNTCTVDSVFFVDLCLFSISAGYVHHVSSLEGDSLPNRRSGSY